PFACLDRIGGGGCPNPDHGRQRSAREFHFCSLAGARDRPLWLRASPDHRPPMQSSNRPVALVTGASSGIGAALARELARHGHDLVLSARSLAPMEALAEELRALAAAVTVIPADLAKAGAAAALVREIEAVGIEIGMLVNNAGLGAIGQFMGISDERNVEIMQVNIVALTELTRLLLP